MNYFICFVTKSFLHSPAHLPTLHFQPLFHQLTLPSHRLAAEQHVTEVLSTLEKAAAAHSDEIQCLRQQLVTQKQLASKYSDKVGR